ncbi:MAG: rubredoxin [Bacteroidales bacterium]|nr:rubredoxin [Bacteroidales bacterium]
MKKYKCKKCGWIYDPKQGDPLSEILPGTPFEELPEDWFCPRCFAPKSEFEKM